MHWLLAASRFQPGKNAGGLAVGPPRPADTRGQHMRWWARPRQLRWGAISDPAEQFGESSRPLVFGLTHTHTLPGIATPVLRWARVARPSATWGILQPTGWAKSQTKAWPLPGPIKPPAFPALQPSLSLGSPISSGTRIPSALTLQDQGLPPGPSDGKSVSREACVIDGYRGAAEAR